MRSLMRFGIAALLLAAMAGSTQAGDSMDRFYARKAANDANYWAQVQANQASKARMQQYSRGYVAPPARTYMLQQMPNRAGYWLYGW